MPKVQPIRNFTQPEFDMGVIGQIGQCMQELLAIPAMDLADLHADDASAFMALRAAQVVMTDKLYEMAVIIKQRRDIAELIERGRTGACRSMQGGKEMTSHPDTNAGSLIKQTLRVMRYQPEAPLCKSCKYFSEKENAYVDRMWDAVCQYSNVTPEMSVSPNGCCSEFVRRKP